MKNKSKLKKIVSSFGFGIAATSAIIPVVACGEEDTITITLPADFLTAFQKVMATTDYGIQNLPDLTAEPTKVEHATWQFKLNNDAATNEAPLKDALKEGDKVTITLLPDSGYKLSEEVTKTVEVKNAITINLPADFQTAFGKVIATTDDGIQNLPDLTTELTKVEHATWQFKLNNDAATNEAPLKDALKQSDKVTITLLPDSGYKLSEEVEKEFTVKTVYEIPNAGDYWRRLDGLTFLYPQSAIVASTFVENDESEHSHWEFQVNDGERVRKIPLDSPINAYSIIKVFFVIDGDWEINIPEKYSAVLNDGIEYTVQPRSAGDGPENLDYSNVLATPSEITGLPPKQTDSQGTDISTFAYAFRPEGKEYPGEYSLDYQETQPVVGGEIFIKMVPTSWPNLFYDNEEVVSTPVKADPE